MLQFTLKSTLSYMLIKKIVGFISRLAVFARLVKVTSQVFMYVIKNLFVQQFF